MDEDDDSDSDEGYESESDEDEGSGFKFDDDSDEDEGSGFKFDDDSDEDEEFTFEDEPEVKKLDQSPQNKVANISSKIEKVIENGGSTSELKEVSDSLRAVTRELKRFNDNMSPENSREFKMRRLMQLKQLKSERGTSETKDGIKNKNYKKDEKEESLKKDYSRLTTDEAYKEVRKFLFENGVRQHPVDVSLLVQEFGTDIVSTLLHKSYIIKIGKGVSIGK